MSSALPSTLRTFLKRPEWKAAATSCVLLGVGDLTCQGIMNRSERKAEGKSSRGGGVSSEIDWQRTKRFSILGFTLHGPYFYHGFQWLDRTIGPSKSVSTALLKTVVGQISIFPIYVASFFVYMGLLEKGNFSHSKQKLRDGFWYTFKTGCLFWPVANMVNFMIVPPSSRVLYVSGVGIVWNAFLSWVNTHSVAAQRLLEQARKEGRSPEEN